MLSTLIWKLYVLRITNFDSIDIIRYWGSSNYQCDFANPSGCFGGILSIWDRRVFCKLKTICSRNFIVTSGDKAGIPSTSTILNVHRPQSIRDQLHLWGVLSTLKIAMNGIWMIIGDFNAIRFGCQRFNSSFF